MTESPRADPTTGGHVDDAVLRAVIEQSSDIVVLWDSAGIVRFVNPAGPAPARGHREPGHEPDHDGPVHPGSMSTVEDAEHTARAKRPWRGLGELRRTGTDVPVPVVLSSCAAPPHRIWSPH